MKKFFLLSSIVAIHAYGLCQLEWSDPIRVASRSEQSDLIYPEAAAHDAGTVAVAGLSTDGHTSGTSQRPYPAYFTANIYATFSSDRGLTWSPPQLLSDPTLHNHQVDVEPGHNPGEFYFLWASGDAFSGYRHHMAYTTDNGQTITSSTRVQPFTDQGQGILYPDMEMAGQKVLVNWQAVDQIDETRPYQWYASTVGEDINTWSEPINMGAPASLKPVASRQSLTAAGSNVISTGFLTTDTLSQNPYPFITISNDSGTSWSEPQFITNDIMALAPATATDGKGLWLTAYIGAKPPSSIQWSNKLYTQRSIDAGQTWTEPQETSASYSRTSYPQLQIAADGNGRWIISHTSSYTISEDDAVSWSQWTAFPLGQYFNVQPSQLLYLGDGKWGVFEYSTSSARGFGLDLRIAQWGPSNVSNWTLY